MLINPHGRDNLEALQQKVPMGIPQASILFIAPGKSPRKVEFRTGLTVADVIEQMGVSKDEYVGVRVNGREASIHDQVHEHDRIMLLGAINGGRSR